MRSPGGGAASACAPRSPASPWRCSSIGLFAAGIGTLAFLRNTLIVSLDAQLTSARADRCRERAHRHRGRRRRRSSSPRRTTPADTQYFVALYDPTATLRVTGGRRRRRPDARLPPSRSRSSRRTTQGVEPVLAAERGRRRRLPRERRLLRDRGRERRSVHAAGRAAARARSTRSSRATSGIYSILALLVVIGGALHHALARHAHVPQPRPGRVHRRRDRRRRLQPAHDRHRADDDRGRAAQDRDQRDARPGGCRDLAARRHRAPDAALHRRREPRAAHAARHRARLRRAVPDGGDPRRRGHRPVDGPHREGGDPHGGSSSRTCSPSRASTSAATW